MLLGVGLEVQPALATCLFNKIPEYFDNDDDNGRLSDSIPRLVLSQFKWLEMLSPDCKVRARPQHTTENPNRVGVVSWAKVCAPLDKRTTKR